MRRCSATTMRSWSTRTSTASPRPPTRRFTCAAWMAARSLPITWPRSTGSGARPCPGPAARSKGERPMNRVEYWNDPGAPAPNSLVPACGVLAVDGKGRVLLQRRRDTGQWALPMGKMELGETPSGCAIRETREETGITVEVTGLLGVFSDPGHIVAYGDGEIRQEYEVIMLARPVSGAPASNDEASEVRWVPPADLG